ncbi:hypothetical protein JB92DRAFT_2972622 [Gautieria morchelliformis]|nr:hypothetical protein JB92DRAFT_2972622 [Gautieria morchelliformis]
MLPSTSTVSGSSSMAPAMDLESVIADITTSISPEQLLTSLRSLVRLDVGESILASVLPGGQDPLTVLDTHANTLGYLFILSARLHVTGAPPVSFATISLFCSTFDAAAARLAPDRVTFLARSIVQVAESHNNLKAAIAPLYSLTSRYPPSLSYLTTLHPYFLHACVASRHFKAALPVLDVTLSEIDTSLSPLTYHDVLNYHYTGALAFLALKRFDQASAYLELVAAAPVHQNPAALQLEALKKLTLVRLILFGATRPLPRYAHPNLWRYLKNTPYAAFAKLYPSGTAELTELVDKEAKYFESECNLGLVRQALDHAPRWTMRKLTATYVTLSLAEIGKAAGITEEESVREIVLNMIELGQMDATLDVSGTVTFHEEERRFSGQEVDKLLKEAQAQGALLGELDRELGRSKEFLSKAWKDKDGGGSAIDEELYSSVALPGYRDWDDGSF